MTAFEHRKTPKSMNALAWRVLGEDKLTDLTIVRANLGEPWTASARGLAPTREYPEGERFVGTGATAQEAVLAMIHIAEGANLRIGSRL